MPGHAILQDFVQVSAVGDAIGCTVAFFEVLTEGQNFQNFAGHAIAHVDGGWAAGYRLHGVPRPQFLQGAHSVGSQLHTGADG